MRIEVLSWSSHVHGVRDFYSKATWGDIPVHVNPRCECWKIAAKSAAVVQNVRGTVTHHRRHTHFGGPRYQPRHSEELDISYTLLYNFLAPSEGLSCLMWLHYTTWLKNRAKNAVRERPLRNGHVYSRHRTQCGISTAWSAPSPGSVPGPWSRLGASLMLVSRGTAAY